MPNASYRRDVPVAEVPGGPEPLVAWLLSFVLSRAKRAWRALLSPTASQHNMGVIALALVAGFLIHMVLFCGVKERQQRSVAWWRLRLFSLLGLSSWGGGGGGAERICQKTLSGSTCSELVAGDVPKHIAVIMDGNRRFGRDKHNDALQGHWAGGQTLVDFIKWCMEEGLEEATLYAFSSENWSRDPLEVNALMAIFVKYAEQLTSEALTRNVRVHVLSTDLERLPAAVRSAIRSLVSATEGCSSFTVNICVSYGGRDEILGACSRLATLARQGQLDEQTTSNGDVVVSEALFRSQLCSAHSRDPDLLIRTSGEYRLSNFLLWQLAYTELFFVDKYWPQMTHSDLKEVLAQYKERNRRFGG